ncbi:MAG: flotillin family protein [Actinomycetota bacterium]
MPAALITILVFVVIAVLVIFIIAFAVTRLYRKVPQGKALVVSTVRNVQVSFVGRVVFPIIHKAEIMDMTVKTMTVERNGALGLVCADNIRADIRVYFYVRVNKTQSDVIQVAQAIGCERASDPALLAELFDAKFNEALKTVGMQMEFQELYNQRQRFRDAVIEIIGSDLNGYVLDDVAIDEIEQTPITQLDPDNILDAQGIRKITEMNEDQHVATTVASEDERKRITEKKVETDKAVLDLERERAEATARQHREIAVVQATEQAETARVTAEQRKLAEMARLATDEEVEVREKNKEREVEIADEVRRQASKVEAERADTEIAKAQAEREAMTVEAERTVEEQKLEIAAIRRDRVDREYGVAEQVERTRTLEVVEAAQREKEATVIAAEASAEEEFLSITKKAAAERQAAEEAADAAKVTASANRAAAEDQAAADLKTAEGTRATTGAAGLAEADVLTAKADADKAAGLAQVEVDAARIGVISATGTAEAEATMAKGQADAFAAGELLRQQGEGEKVKAEAAAMMEESGRGHAEYMARLEVNKAIEIERITADAEVGKLDAEARAEAFKQASFDIVGGADDFVDAITASATHARRVDRLVGDSDVLTGVLNGYVDGEGDLIAELSRMVQGFGADGARDTAVAALLGRLAASDDPKAAIEAALGSAARLGAGASVDGAVDVKEG